jgi:hypothetical protein
MSSYSSSIFRTKSSNGLIAFCPTTGIELCAACPRDTEQLYKEGYMDDVDALVIAEPSESGIVYAHKGSMDYQLNHMFEIKLFTL